MIHPKARDSMKKQLRKVLEGCQLANGLPVFESFGSDFYDFSKGVLKNKGQWLSTGDMYGIFMKILTEALMEKYSHSTAVNGLLKDLFSASLIDDVEGKIITFIESVPREYVIYIPLPLITDIGIEELSIGNGVVLLQIDKAGIPGNSENEFLETLTSQEKIKRGTYLRINACGYASWSLDDSAFQSAISVLKQVIYLGKSQGIFKERRVALTGVGLLGNQRYMANLEILAVSDKSEHVEGRASLSNNFAKLIENLIITEELKDHSDAKKVGEYVPNAFLRKFDDIRKLLTTKEDDTFSAAIKSAIEWAFDAGISDNQTVSFVQACIGLEAILGEEAGNEPLTATLSDRCAYLLGRNPRSRKQIREDFKKLYSIRSKVVHGRAVRLSEGEQYYLEWAKSILHSLIKKELTLIPNQ